MTSLFTLVRAMLAVLLVSTGYCNAAEHSAASSAAPVNSIVIAYDSDGSHCEAHCDFRAMSVLAHRDLVKAELAKLIPPSAPTLVAVERCEAQPRAPPLDFFDDVGRGAVDHLKTVRLLI